VVLAERGRVKLDDEPGRWAREALGRSPVREAPLTNEVAIHSREIAPSHPDPADRFIVSTALVYELTLVTADDALLDLRLCSLLPGR
jgi:PIN domain nuclease of toxin-antitoxin system